MALRSDDAEEAFRRSYRRARFEERTREEFITDELPDHYTLFFFIKQYECLWCRAPLIRNIPNLYRHDHYCTSPRNPSLTWRLRNPEKYEKRAPRQRNKRRRMTLIKKRLQGGMKNSAAARKAWETRLRQKEAHAQS